jgi:hypothetical protein
VRFALIGTRSRVARARKFCAILRKSHFERVIFDVPRKFFFAHTRNDLRADFRARHILSAFMRPLERARSTRKCHASARVFCAHARARIAQRQAA